MDGSSSVPSVVFGSHCGSHQPAPTNSYQTKEIVLYGSILDTQVETLVQRLKGLCDPGVVHFNEHEMVMSLRTGHDPDVTVRIRRHHKDSHHSNTHNMWHLRLVLIRYVGGPEPDATCPAIVRKCIDSVMTTPANTSMMEVIKALGLRMDYEYLAKGQLFTKGNVKVIIEQLQKTDRPGSYQEQDLKHISDSHLITMTMSLPENGDYKSAAKHIREFADQLDPLANMEKVDYWLKKSTA
ncbi:hypothetical protein L596_006210 [Steinernema carpocapsae]|uniref:Mediator of RNA polymerase II transcription subunit 18 n=1 Tax=Steinernema carpocapsae TaxID=34508 RepID=A0A4U8V912_STECR|nr:hypothetical protein L596_006210 [Steinernema carpocapsae]